MRAARRARALAFVVIASLGLGQAETIAAADEAASGKPLVVVSVLPQSFVVKAIAGDLVDVEVLLPPGASPASYEPTPAQLAAVARARLFVKVGHKNFPMEKAWLDQLLGGRRLRMVDSCREIVVQEEDPHVWVVPKHVAAMARDIESALESLLPAHDAVLRSRLADFLDQTEALDTELRTILEPVKGQRFFVLHPAWGYFADEYGLEQVAVQHENKTPDLAQLSLLIRGAMEAGAPVIFVQPQFDPTAAKMVAREVGARIEELDPLAFHWNENLREVATRVAAASVAYGEGEEP